MKPCIGRCGVWFAALSIPAAAPCRAADEPEAGGKPLSYWLKQLNDPKGRSAAIEAVGQIGPEARAAVPKLAKLLDAKVGFDRGEAARRRKEEEDRKEAERKAALAKRSSNPPPTRVKTEAELRIEAENRKREEAARKQAADAVEGVDIHAVGTAMAAIAKDEATARPAVTSLITALETYDSLDGGKYRGDALECIRALEALGANAKTASRLLAKLIGGTQGVELSEAAGNAIAVIAPADDYAQVALMKRAQDKDERIALSAIGIIKKLGKAGKDCIATLKTIRDSSPAGSAVAAAAGEAIKAIEE